MVQSEWISTFLDLYQRYLRGETQFFYVFTKACVILFTYSGEKPVAIMNTTMRSMRLTFEKYAIQCAVVLRDLTETPLQGSTDPAAQVSSSQTCDDFMGTMSSQFVFDLQKYAEILIYIE